MGSAVEPVAMTGLSVSLLSFLLPSSLTLAQRRPPQESEYEDHNRRNRVGGGGAPHSGRPNMDVGQFPYPRGETPVFNFDQGDEGFIGTIPPLIHALNAVKDTVHKQRKITKSFGEAFDQCEACG